MPNGPEHFDENFAYLRENGVIPPEYPAASVPQEVKEVIASLSQAEMDRFRDICLQTHSFIYLHDHGPRGTSIGL